jgi:hypothetical protein
MLGIRRTPRPRLAAMNRNVQLFAVGVCVLAACAVAWWATSGRQKSGATRETTETARALPGSVEEYAHVLDGSQEPVEETIESDGTADKDRRVAADPVGIPGLVSGVIHDGNGKPVEGARVVVTDSPFPRASDTDGVLAAGTSDAQGRFEIHGTVPPPRSTFAWASKDGFLRSSPKQFARGAEGVQLVLQGSGVVSGRLLLDPGVATDRVTLEITAVADERRKSFTGLVFASNQHVEDDGFIEPPPFRYEYSRQFKIDAEGRFAVAGFAGPAVSVTVRPIDDPAQPLEIRDVVVQRAGAAPDPRIDPIDLRGKVKRVAVDVIDDVGTKRDGARVTSRAAGRTGVERSQFTRDGRAEFLVWSGPRDVDVCLDGFRTVRLSGVEGDQVVQLRKGIQVRVTVRGSATRPAPPDLLAVGLMQGTRIHPILDGIGTLQDPNRTTFVVASPGPHDVGWYLERGSIRAYLETGTTQSVDVRDQEGIQEIVVSLPSSAQAAWTDLFERREAEARQRAVQQRRDPLSNDPFGPK